MTRHTRHMPLANAVARQVKPESFATACEPELGAAPLHVPGICYLPECSRCFDPARPWAKYCSPACEAKGKQEFRSWGHRLAEPMLCHRIGKYETRDPAIQDRTRAARRYVTQLQSAWSEDREARRMASGIFGAAVLLFAILGHMERAQHDL